MPPQPAPSLSPRKRTSSVETLNLRCAEAFSLIDKNSDGTLTRIEVIQACRSDHRVRELLRLPESIRQEDGSRDAFEEVFQKMDKDDSKGVNLEEFMVFWKEEARRAPRTTAVRRRAAALAQGRDASPRARRLCRS